MKTVKKSLTAMLLGMSLVFAMNATAQVPSDESLIEFMQLSEMDKAFDLGMQGSLDAQRQLFEAQIAQKEGVTPEQAKQVGMVFEKHVNQVIGQVITPQSRQQINQIFIDVAKKYYTQEEIDAYNEFLSTPIGKSVVQKTNIMTPEYMDKLQKLVVQMLIDNPNLNNEKMQQDIEKEIERIFAEWLINTVVMTVFFCG